MSHENDPDGERLPIKLDVTTNGEYMPRPLSWPARLAKRTAERLSGENARRLGQSRRSFLVSLSGAATGLLALNQAMAAAGKRGGFYDIPKQAALDPALAEAALGKKEFIFDIQTHHFDPPDDWRAASPWSEVIKQGTQGAQCVLPDHDFGHLACSDARVFAREIFIDSDTDAAILSFVPTTEDKMPLSYAHASATRQIVEAMEGGGRCLLQGRIIPNLPGDLERMESVLSTWDITSWKTYTQYGPDGASGWWFDDEEHGMPFLEKVRASGVRTICVHKGLPLPFPLMGEENLDYGSCRDIGPAAKANPEINFIVYHSGFDPGRPEGPFVRGAPVSGTDSLVQTLLDSGLGHGSNVYAELGSTWHAVMSDPDQAAHLLGKLLKYLGEDNVLWGTDCIFYGSPQDQIQALRTFQFSAEFQERYGYPPLTDAIRAKIFGLSSARIYGLDVGAVKAAALSDSLGRAKANYRNNPDPSFLTYGPKSRREVLNLARLEDH